jgi:glycyl-tRNA synthetase
MVFIVKKKIGKNEYYYLRESKRIDGKVVAKTIAYLGKDRKGAEEKAAEIARGVESRDDEAGSPLANEKGKGADAPSVKKIGDNKKVGGEGNRTEVIEDREIGNIDESNKSLSNLSIDELATFCKRRGFVYPSGEIYGGMAGFWDYGPVGVELVNNIKNEWWKFHVQQREDMAGIDGSIITNPKVWEASGHVENFVDVFVQNKKTGEKTKVDKHEVSGLGEEWEVKGDFNPMFTTKVGPGEDSVSAYLRPETAQLIFADFRDIWENARLKLPAGIAQIGKAFRNEISPREFLFRAREFEQMEIEYFISKGMKCPYIDEIRGIEVEVFSEKDQRVKAESGEKIEVYDAWKKGIIKTDWHAYWIAEELRWFVMLGANPEKFRARQHTSEEKSHYAIDTWDLEYKFPMGWRELQGFANRGTWDLGRHAEYSGKKMDIQGEDGKKVLPEVVCEPSLGVGRAFTLFLLDAYEFDSKRGNIVLHLSPRLAPFKAGVFPLIGKTGGEHLEMAREVFKDLKEEFNVFFDKSGSIGRRYARQDEIGTPYCITVDGDSLKGKDVTIRERDSTKQIRVKVKDLRRVIREFLEDKENFESAGKVVETRVK